MKRHIVLYLLLLISSIPSYAQLNSYRSFDFIIGEWKIKQKILDKNGEWLSYSASTSFNSILGGKAIEENWKGIVKFFWTGMEESELINGFSLRYYQPQENTWYIYWMDELKTEIGIPYKGSFTREGYGEFYKTTETEKGSRQTRITFQKINEDELFWELAYKDDNKKWIPLWTMHMNRN